MTPRRNSFKLLEDAEYLREDRAAADFPTSSALVEPNTNEPDTQKLLDTLRAVLALRGHQVHGLASGGFLVCWLGHSRHCGDMVSLEAFARQVGAVE